MAGFISELGQSGLFVGCSVMSGIQLFLSTTLLFYTSFIKVYKKFAITLKYKQIGNTFCGEGFSLEHNCSTT
ncbi:unnamed protein product [Strongylus vulgaris]|uniref:Uncharacterized protein n=1 Tax=Strongylus vulgaris TaxID=40348 RepID=A0A3P7LEJ5_STRVU|nr:unnamed protein product [Strongylus vulgaris]